VPGEKRSHQRTVGAAVTIAAGALASYGACALPAFQKHLQSYLAIDDRAYGFLFSTWGLGTAATALVAGVLVDRKGPVRILRGALLGLGLAMLLMAASGRLWLLLAGGLGVMALFQTFFSTAANVYLVRAFPGRPRRMLSLNLAVTSGVAVILPALAAALLNVSQRMPQVSFGLILHAPFGLIACALLLARFLYRREPLAAAAPPQAFGWRDLMLPRPTLALVLLTSVHAVADSTLYVWMPRYLGSAAFPSCPIAPGLVLSACSLAYLVSRSAMVLVPEHRGRRAFLVAPGMLGGAALLAGILSRSFFVTVAGYVLGSLIWSAEYPAILGAIADQDSRRFGTASAVVSFVTAIGTFLMLNGVGLLVGGLGEVQMWKALLIPAAGFPLFSLGATLWLAAHRDGIPRGE